MLKKIVDLRIPVIIDGDGLWHLVNQPSTLAGYPRAVITPNTVELNYLYNTFCGPQAQAQSQVRLDQAKMCEELSVALGRILVVSKGPVDRITSGHSSLECNTRGSARYQSSSLSSSHLSLSLLTVNAGDVTARATSWQE